MKREDYGLGFLIEYENVAWYEDGVVRILDRRVYPMEKKYYVAHTYSEVAKAISDMVTQSGGPFSAAAMGMVLATENCKHKSVDAQMSEMDRAAYELSHARPTTSTAMQYITERCFSHFKNLVENECENITDKMFEYAIQLNNERYLYNCNSGKVLAEIIPNGSTVLTQCFGEVAFGGFFRALNEMDKKIKVVCAETRPFLQGARLTADLANSMGFDTTVITDNVPAYLMSEKKVDYFISASDLVTQNKYVINKVGTLQIAILAKYFGIPYYAFGTPSIKHPNIDSVVIEYRNPNDSLQFLGKKTTTDGVKGLYPAFDITPPELCSGIVTDTGII